MGNKAEIERFLAKWSAAELSGEAARLGDCLTDGDAAVMTARLNQPGTYQGNPIPSTPRATLVLVNPPGLS